MAFFGLAFCPPSPPEGDRVGAGSPAPGPTTPLRGDALTNGSKKTPKTGAVLKTLRKTPAKQEDQRFTTPAALGRPLLEYTSCVL